MAQRGIQLDQEKLCCSICLDLLKDPVTIPCGHSYCMSCIENYWVGEDQEKSHSCPQCRQTFTPKPSLVKSTMLADLVEEVKRTGLQAAPADLCYAGPEDVACDFCTGRKLKALKSCLQCVVSYCEQHLQPHYEVVQLKKHKLVDPSKELQENICTHHNEVMKIFCRTDQQCICYLCSMDEHKGHDTVSAAAEMAERQKELRASRQKIQQRIQKRQEDEKVLQQEVEAIDRSADEAVRESEKIFTDAKRQIRSRQQSEVTHVNGLQEKLRQEIAELSGKDAELQRLERAGDAARLLHSYASLSRLGEASESPSDLAHSQRFAKDVGAAVAEVRDKLQGVFGEERVRISLAGPEDSLPPQAELETREEFLEYSCEVTLDLNTAHKYVSSSNSLEARYSFHNNAVSGHPDKFTDWCQILCRQSLTGRCYWEVKWNGTGVFLAVAYKNMSRAGRESAFGHNDKSWALQCFHDGYEFRHNNMRTSLSGPPSSTVGVYLDHRAGVLSFYSVSETMSLLHRVQTTFTQPLSPGFGLHFHGASVEIREASKTDD